jgi:hypothetical protein
MWGCRKKLAELRASALAALALAALAAVFPEVVRKGSERGEDRAVVDIGPLASRLEQPGSCEPVDVMTQRRRGNIQLGLELARSRAVATRLDDVTENREPGRVSERAELFRMPLQLSRHPDHSSILEEWK